MRWEKLIIDEKCTKFHWLIQKFPKLEIVEWKYLYQLQYSQAVKFLKLNPQLKGLFICYCEHIKSRIFQNMADWVPDLEKLVFWTNSYLSSGRFHGNEHIINISKLWSLKSLSIYSCYAFSVKKLIDSLIENNVPIENLLLLSRFVCRDTSKPNISQLKLLKELYVAGMTDEILIDYVENLPKLEVLFCDDSKITINGIKTALQYGKQLSHLVVEMDRPTAIDLGDYTLILNLAKSRAIKVEIYNLRGTINVTGEFLKENREWLHVKNDVVLSSGYYIAIFNTSNV